MSVHPTASDRSSDARAISWRGDSGEDVALPSLPSDADPSAESPIADVALVRSILLDAARAGESVSYSAFLHRLGLPFSRPNMRALCRTLDRVDQEGELRGEPGLAVLVVRESDGLPGQGWWAGWRSGELGWESDWTGPAARAFVEEHQRAAFDWWASR